ncbi:MAG: hypothetical protein PHR26_02540 [Candidatus ainarchaeum sp.]|nr:hypothetical protein [Candidatus ainarchaeum sp.]MDD3975819.1 hypothetical protein [Candidatus ainarchaeum sp.]
MGLNLFKKKEKTEEKNKVQEIDLTTCKYPTENCALCNKPGCDKKWGGQYWHKKCLRSAKGMAKGMI